MIMLLVRSLQMLVSMETKQTNKLKWKLIEILVRQIKLEFKKKVKNYLKNRNFSI